MKFKIKKLTTLLIIGLIFPLIITNNFNFSVGQTTFNNLKSSQIYSGIKIDALATSNTTYSGNWTWALSQLWCTGSGTPEEPYLIEYETFVSAGGECLIITNSRKDFIIKNCIIYGSNLAGLFLENVTNGQILNNDIFNNGLGIVLWDVNDTIISNNQVYNNGLSDGIFLQLCYFNTISGNIVYNNSEFGIDLKGSDFNVLTGNIVYNNSWSGIVDGSGIFVQTSDYNVLTGNMVYNNSKYGIHLKTSDLNNLSGNIVYNNTEDGINLDNCDLNILSGNNVIDNENWGIYLFSCDYNNITANFIDKNVFYGIILENSDYDSILGNTITENGDYGIYFYDSCNNNTISNNIVSSSVADGIHIELNSYSNIISGNSINNNDCGISLDGCDFNEITENILNNNTWGIYIESGSNNNSLYENFFLKNGKHANDLGNDNKWNSTTIGNYWDNHTGPDEDPPYGIVDFPYNISGSAGSKDYIPIAEDGTPKITIYSPTTGEKSGMNAPSFNVTIIDDYVFEMWYTLDGGLHNYTFSGFMGIINQSAWDKISEGNVTLTFYARDIPGNVGTAEVTIIKYLIGPITPNGLDPAVIITIVIVSVVGGIAVIASVYIFMKKRMATEKHQINS